MSTSNNNINITISGHHIEVTPALEAEINNMIHKLQHKFNHITKAHVLLKIDNSSHLPAQLAEAELHLSHKKEPIFAKVSSDNMYDSLNALSDKLSRQITKHKESLSRHVPHDNHDHHHIKDLKDLKNNKKL
jgi:putative sigma-54 modulation protein